MATALSLALKISADASAFRLDPVQKALVALGDQTDKIIGQFDKFAAATPAAAQAQQEFADKAAALTNALRDGNISATEFAVKYEQLGAAAKASADAFAEGAAITERNRTAAERFDAAQVKLRESFEKGAISEQTFNRETERLAKGLTDAEREARGLPRNIEEMNKQTLKFNELSGVFAILPGPLGNIAGRISGITSAGEGLARVFSGGLSSGISGIAGSITSLINPFTVAAAGVAGLGAAAASVVSGLTQLEDRVEKLGNTADKLGTSFEFVQVLDEAARRSGTSIDAVSAAFGRLQKSVLGVDEESKAAQAALATIGVTAEELRKMKPEEQYKLIGERLAAIEDPAQRTAVATNLFGKAGAELLPFFRNLGSAAADMERFGATLSAIDRGRIDSLGNSFDALFVSLRGLGQSLLTPFAGLVEGITSVLAEAIGAVTRYIRPFLEAITPALDAIGRGFKVFADSIGNDTVAVSESLGGVARLFQSIFDVLSAAVEAAAPGIESAFNAVTETVTQLGTVFADSFDAIFGALTSFAETVAELLGFSSDLEGVGAAIGTAFGAVYETLGQVYRIFGDVIEVISRFVTVIAVGVLKAGETIAKVVSQFLAFTGLGSALQAIGQTIASVFGGVASVFSTIANAIGGVVGRLLTMAERFLGIERSTKSASDATQQLAESANNATKSSETLTESEKRRAEYAKQAADEAQKIAEAETKRVNDLLALQSPIDKLAQDITATNNEIVRTEAALAAARAAEADAEVARLTQRLAQLDQLQASLQEQSDQAAQGFAEGFDKAFANVDKGIGTLIDKSAEFGQAGFEAAQQLTDGIEKAKAAVKDGILNKEAFDREVERQKKLYEDRVKGLQEAAKITEQLYKKESELLTKQFEIDRERAVELAAIRTGAIKIQDIRTGGITAFFDTLKEDPAIGEAKKQTKELQKIREEIAKLQSERVDILAGTG